MKWQQKHKALVETFGRATLAYDHGKFTVQLSDGWVFNSAGINRETGQGATAPQAIGNLFDKMAHPAANNVPGNMNGALYPKKWDAQKRKFTPF